MICMNLLLWPWYNKSTCHIFPPKSLIPFSSQYCFLIQLTTPYPSWWRLDRCSNCNQGERGLAKGRFYFCSSSWIMLQGNQRITAIDSYQLASKGYNKNYLLSRIRLSQECYELHYPATDILKSWRQHSIICIRLPALHRALILKKGIASFSNVINYCCVKNVGMLHWMHGPYWLGSMGVSVCQCVCGSFPRPAVRDVGRSM